jgi:peptidoglycan hydrolase-like protein with peptidoglycan-binding domain
MVDHMQRVHGRIRLTRRGGDTATPNLTDSTHMPRDYSKTEILDIIEKEAKERGIPRDDFLRFAYIETGGRFDETASRGPNGAKGLFQFVPDTARAYGIAGRELDPVANTDAAARLYLDNRQALVNRHARDGRPYLSGSAQPDGLDMYLAHQQGAAGYRSIQSAIATGEFSRDDTRRNILNNISSRDFEKVTGRKYESLASMSDRDLATSFTTYWDRKFDRIQIPEKNIGPVTQANAPAQTTPAQTAQAQVPVQSRPAQANGIELNDAHALTLKYDHVKYAMSGRIAGVSGKNPDQGYVDCSGWVATMQNATMAEINREAGREVFSRADRFSLGNDGAAMIVQKAEERSGVMLTGAQVTRGALKEGMIIGEDNGPTRWDGGRYKGIDHIVMVVRDPNSGELMVSQSRGGEGVELSSLDRYLERKQANGVKLYATDPLAEARTLLQDRSQSQTQGAQRAAQPVDAMADGVLKRGEDGAAVKHLQAQLSTLGYKRQDGQPFNATGHYGDHTVAAVAAFQKANGLPATGDADRATRQAIDVQWNQQRTPTQATPVHTTPAQSTPTSAPLQSNTASSSLASPQHPDHALYRQALSNLEQLGPSGGFKSREQMEQAAGALAADAKATGLDRIDHVSRSSNGQGFLIAVQGVNGDPSHPAAKHAYIDYTQATTQTLEQSTRMADARSAETPQVAQQAQETQRRGP